MHSLVMLTLMSLLELMNSSVGQLPTPKVLTGTVAGTYTIRKMIVYSSTQPKQEVSMPKVTARGDTFSAVIVAQIQGGGLLRMNMTQYHNKVVQLNFWIGDLTMKVDSPNVYDLYLGVDRVGRIENKKLALDFRQSSFATDESPKSTHLEGVKQ